MAATGSFSQSFDRSRGFRNAAFADTLPGATDELAQEIDMGGYAPDLDARLHDLRGLSRAAPPCTTPTPMAPRSFWARNVAPRAQTGSCITSCDIWRRMRGGLLSSAAVEIPPGAPSLLWVGMKPPSTRSMKKRPLVEAGQSRTASTTSWPSDLPIIRQARCVPAGQATCPIAKITYDRPRRTNG